MTCDRTNVTLREKNLGSANANEAAKTIANSMFAIALGAAACRQWLAQDPPRTDEVATALHHIAAAAARFQAVQSDDHTFHVHTSHGPHLTV